MFSFSQRNRLGIKGMYVVDDFNHILKNIKFRWYFLASQHFSMDDTFCRYTFRSDLFDPNTEMRKPSTHGSSSICAYKSPKWPNSGFLKCYHSFKDFNNSASFVVLVGNRNSHNIYSCTYSWKIHDTKQPLLPFLSKSVDLSTWTAYHCDSLILTVVPQFLCYFINSSTYGTS